MRGYMNTTSTQKNRRQETLLFQKKAVEQVIKSVSQKLEESVSMDEMARMANMSPFHFNRVFHQITGLPPAQFLYAMRLEKAKQLLLITKMSVTEICFAVGYNSLGTFTSRFTELVGLSPREFRHLAAKVSAFDWDEFFNDGWQAYRGKTETGYFEGEIVAPENFAGIIFIGLFEKMIPQSRPKAGTLLVRGGVFQIGPLPEGEFNLLAAALPRAKDPLDYLLVDLSKILVGFAETSQFLAPGLEGEQGDSK